MRNFILTSASWLAGRLPQALLQRIYRIPPLARFLRSTLNRAAPEGISVVEIAGGILAGCKIELNLHTEKDLWLGTYEPELQAALKAFVKPGAVVYDVGANIGYVSLMCAKCAGETGRVFSFEPLPENQARLERTLDLNNLSGRVTLVKMAAGRHSGRTTFRVHASTSMGRIDPVRTGPDRTLSAQNGAQEAGPDRTLSGQSLDQETGPSGDGSFQRAIEVELISLDEFVFSEGSPPPDVIKLDIEGGEVEALPGMRRLLQDHHPLLLVEVHGTEAGRVVWHELTAAGYQLSWMRPGYPPVSGIDALQGKAYVVAQHGEAR
jgi:FkbM family methyltransferase